MTQSLQSANCVGMSETYLWAPLTEHCLMKFLSTVASILFICISLQIKGQGEVRGKITDDLGESIIGATIVFKDNPSQGANTDFDGNYSLKLPTDNWYKLIVSFIGFQSKEIEVSLSGGAVKVINVGLLPKNFDIGEVVIEAKANKANDYYMEKIKMNSATSFDFISAETLRKTGDRNLVAAMRRVPGVSFVGNSVTVRGLADRYIRTTVNGARVPTLDPFTNNIDLDIFPTGLIDNLIVTKTLTPDLPADWSGAFISVETKDYPDKLQVRVSTTVSYTGQTNFQNIVAGDRSSTDWLGWDDGLRAIPAGVPRTQAEFPQPVTNSTLYQQFSLLGIEGNLNNFGITSTTPIDNGGVLHQLGLVELGLMGPAQIGNTQAFQQALNNYNEQYPRSFFFERFNSEFERIGQSFPNNWFAGQRKAPLNFGQSLSIGNQTKLFGKTLGYIAGFRYNQFIRFDPNSTLNRTTESPDYQPDEGGVDIIALANDLRMDQQVSSTINAWNALLSLSYKLNENNSLSILAMPNIFGEEQVRMYEGRSDDQNTDETLFGHDLIYTQRKQLIYQYKSDHYIPAFKGKLHAMASYVDGQSDVLDFKDTRWLYDATQDRLFFQTTFNPNRRFRLLDENLFDSHVHLDIPLPDIAGRKAKVKTGIGYMNHNRSSEQTQYRLLGANGQDIVDPLEEVLSLDRFSVQGRSNFDLSYSNASSELDADIGRSKVFAAFAMGDVHVHPKVRLVGGVRLETTNIYTDIRAYDEANLPVDDPGRRNIGGKTANPGIIDTLNILPSMSVIYHLREDDKSKQNLRLNYFQSLARPSFRELSAVELFDFEFIAMVRGNNQLNMVNVNNYDIRYEAYFNSGDYIILGGFYKTFQNHIELIQTSGGGSAVDVFSWQNAEDSYAVGFEIEGKKIVTKSLEFRGNVSLIESKTTITVPVKKIRPMFGQAPYIVNATLAYAFEKMGLNAAVTYNIQGPRVATVLSTGVNQPNVVEVPQHLIDFNVIKNFGAHFSANFRVRNMLNAPQLRAYDFDEGYLLDFDRFTWGPLFSLTVSYSL